MKVLLTGATGQVGSAILRALVADGWRVQGLARSEAAAGRIAEAGAEPVRGDLADPRRLAELAGQADAVAHAAFTWDEEARRLETGAVAVFVEALRGSDKPLVVTSGAGVLGDTGPEPKPEDAQPLQPSWRYELERAVTAAEGLRGVVVRPTLVYDAAGHRILRRLAAKSQAVGAGVYVGNGAARWSTVHADDLGRLYALVLRSPDARGVYHAASGEVEMQALARVLSARLGFGGRTLSWPVAEAQPELPAAAQLQHNILVTGERAKALGWRPAGPALLDVIASAPAFAGI